MPATPDDSPGPVRRAAARLVGALIVFLARLVTAVRADWAGAEPVARTRIYFANHTSNGDFVLIWTVLPPGLRRRTRPVAGMDYWERSAIRRFVIHDVFHAVGVVRGPGGDPVEAGRAMGAALAAGRSLILFPEGTRNTTEAPLLPFRPGLWHLAQDHPEAELVPVWIENLNRVMPKGEIVPVPLICTVTFGAPLARVEGEGKQAFLSRARAALLATRPGGEAP
jgi:1-acyl-sn-glycerol-3-phosphate acyltransferase